jgi:hypothetical protein
LQAAESSLQTKERLQELIFKHNIFVPLMKQAYETLSEQQILDNDDLEAKLNITTF